MAKTWKERSSLQKAVCIGQWIVAVAMVVLLILQIAGVFKNNKGYLPGISVLMLLQTIENWQDDKKTAKVSLFACVFTAVVSVLDIFVF